VMMLAFTSFRRRSFVLNADTHSTDCCRLSHQAAGARIAYDRTFEVSSRFGLTIHQSRPRTTSSYCRASPGVSSSTRRSRFMSELDRRSCAADLSARQRDGPLARRADIPRLDALRNLVPPADSPRRRASCALTQCAGILGAPEYLERPSELEELAA
jgi:hypothetical protein